MQLSKNFLVISLILLGLGLYWASVGLAKDNTQSVAVSEFFAGTPFGVHNPFRDWENKLHDKNYKNKITEKLRELGVGWVTDSVFRKRVEKLNWNYINTNGYTNKKGEIFFASLPPYDKLVKTDFETTYDNLVEAYENAGVKILFVINPKTRYRIKETIINGKTNYQLIENLELPETEIDYEYYKEFVRKLVSKYGNRVAGWFVFNEPSRSYFKHFKEQDLNKKKALKAAVKNYAKLVEITYAIIKDINPNAVVILGGASAMQKVDFCSDVLDILQEKKNSPLYGTGGFDAWDYHTYGFASEYKKIWGGDRKVWKNPPEGYEKYENEPYRYYELYRDVLNYNGFDTKPLISIEGATYTGEDPRLEKPKDSGRELLLQDEADQAAFLVKRAIHLLSKGVKLINWSTILENESLKKKPRRFFNYTGLVYNGRINGNVLDPPGDLVPKLAFYTYKFLIEKLKDANWGSFREVGSYPISNDSKFNLSVYEFKNKEGETKYIAWVDYHYYDNVASPPTRLELPLPIAVTLNLPALAEKQVKITKSIPNNKKVFESSIASFGKDGKIVIEFNKEPVYIELKQPQ